MKLPPPRQKRGRRWLLLVGAALFSGSMSLSAQDIILIGGAFFDAEHLQLVENGALVIRAGRIHAIVRPGESLPDFVGDTLRLHENQVVLPGFFDLHAHYNVNLFGRKRREEFEVMPIVYLANGVTSTFPAGEYDPEGMLALRRRIDSGEQIGPRIYNSGPYFGTARPGWDRNMSVDSLVREIDYWVSRGIRGLKVKRISARLLKPLIERAHFHGLTVTGHLDSGYGDTVNPRDAILMGIDRIEHFLGGDMLDASRPAYAVWENLDVKSRAINDIIRLFLKHRVYFDATITAYGHFGKRAIGYDYWIDEQKFFTPLVRQHLQDRGPRRMVEQFEKIFWVKHKTIKRFYDAGGEDLITLGTDHPSWGEYLPGFGLHRELEAFVRAGIPAAAALKFATLNGARALGVGDRFGSITVGKIADLVVIDGNPLKDIRHTRQVRYVLKAGVLYDAEMLLKQAEGKLGPKNETELGQW